MIDLDIKTGRISKTNLDCYIRSGYLPVFICRFVNYQTKFSPTALKRYRWIHELGPWSSWTRLISRNIVEYNYYLILLKSSR